ncbi:MAG TPA: DUF1016 domain-containing protein [Lentisphaeria bacterium]|nr:MAG: hypothetical protein A2X48_21695 [Lentisphaerae bacterium GWF2_49_21]HBC85812.1 DUF1016 domain-containing protein [Lentisphaeria bacterium]
MPALPAIPLRSEFIQSVMEILRNARHKVYRSINFTMVEAYWNIGRMILEEEQQGRKRAGYGEFLIKNLSARLTEEFGHGYTEANLKNFRQFYVTFSSSSDCKISYALRSELRWTHYRLLMRVEKPDARNWYMKEAADQNWSTRALERQINSLYYERLLLSHKKTPVKKEAKEKTALLCPAPSDFIRDPYVLEFLGIPDAHPFRESDVEEAIIGKLQSFMLELGRGFAFVARQKRISTETKDFFIDLLFYNYILKCFVIIDLKTGELTHQDIGQMDMYVRYFEDKIRGSGDSPTIGIILCTEKDETVVKYSVLKGSKQLFASKYKLYLPTEQELKEEISREKALVVRELREAYG